MGKRGIAGLLSGAIAVAAIVGFWIWRAQPVTLVDVPGDKIACVSYTPFRGNQTPFDQSLVIPPAQIEEDLAQLKTETDCVRTYAVNQGLDQVVPIAGRLGLKVLMGVWIGNNAADNEAEIARAIKLAKAHRQVLKGVIVGNEVLLRREQTADTVIDMLRRVRAETGVPVTYADVWEFWLRYPQVADAVDFITIHILPYWEDDPIPADQGVAHIAGILQQIEQAFPGKTIFVGETGYPSAGRQREQAVPGLIEQARFIREFLTFAHIRQLDYNVIEAFDQPWKRQLEGTAGGYWGVFGENRLPKFPLQGPMARFASPWPRVGLTLALALLIWWPNRRGAASTPMAFAIPALAVAAGLAITLHLDHALLAALRWHEWLVEGALVLISVLSGMLGLGAIESAAPRPAPARQSLEWLRRFWRIRPDAATALGALQLLTVAGSATVALGLTFDGRYRDFPIWSFAVPTVAFALIAARDARQHDRIESVFALLLAVLALFVALNENLFMRPEIGVDVNAALRPLLHGQYNGSALVWCVMLLILAYPLAAGAFRSAATRGKL